MSFIYPGGDAQVTTNLGLATWGMDEVLAENMILIDAAVGSGGTTIQVNGITISNPNFNDSTPAAPAGKTNIIWQVTGSSVSAYGNSGTVTSVAVTAPSEFSVSGSPITTSGTIALTKATQTANTVWAGPTTGAAAQPAFRALVAADLPAGTGTVTSVALTMPNIFSVAGSPVTSSGTLAVTLATESANTVWAGPTTGSAATPAFRSLVAADLPAGTGTVTSVAMTGDGVIFNSTVSGSPITTTGTLVPALLTQTANTFLAGPTSGGAATPTFRAIGSSDIPTGTVLWNQIGNASGALTLNNTTFGTTFNQTSTVAAATWKWANTTPTFTAIAVSAVTTSSGGSATYTITNTAASTANGFVGALVTIAGFVTGANNGTFTCTASTLTTLVLSNASASAETHAATATGSLVGSPVLTLSRQYSTGSGGSIASSEDTWSIQITSDQTTTNPREWLNISHSGTTGQASIGVPIGSATSPSITGGTATTSGLAFPSGNSIAAIFTGASVLRMAGSATTLAFVMGNAVVPGWSSNVNPYAAGLDTGMSRLGAGSVAFGNGTANDTTGNLSFNTVIKYAGNTTVSNGIPSEIVLSDLTAQTAAIGATTLVSAPVTGMYRVCWSATITTAASVSSVLGGTNGFQVIYTSPTDSVAKTTVSGLSVTSAANTTATAVGGDIIIYAKTGTNIQYKYDYTSSGTAMAFELHIRLELL